MAKSKKEQAALMLAEICRDIQRMRQEGIRDQDYKQVQRLNEIDSKLSDVILYLRG